MISIIIPAHNEEKYLPGCLDSIARAAGYCGEAVEIVLASNRSYDATEAIAKGAGAKIVIENDKNLAKVRNAGVNAATGDIIITIDADSRMPEDALRKIKQYLSDDKIIGGVVDIKLDRYSFPLRFTQMLLNIVFFFTGLGGGMFWIRKADFYTAGGFNEKLKLAEDLDFAKQVIKLARKTKRKFIRKSGITITTSTRKFDKLGDWYFLKSMFKSKDIKKGLKGEDSPFTDEYFYHFND